MKFRYRRFSRLFYAVLLLIGLTVFGIMGYMSLEGFTLSEAAYMTIITMSTVGFNEVHELSDTGRYFTMFLVITSFGSFAYSISAITSYVMDGELNRYFRGVRKRKALEQLSNHIIICGYGRNGFQASWELKNVGVPFVVIERVESDCEKAIDDHGSDIVINGDATQDKVLQKAGVERAKALITTLPHDADNLFVVLSARGMNDRMTIVSRASKDNSDVKLKRAGADNVIMPDKIGGAHMASLVTKPDVMEFFDYLLGQGTGKINIAEITFESLPDSLKNKSIRELGVRDKSGANVVGFRQENGDYVINPSPDTIIHPNNKIFVLGTPEQIQSFRNMLSHG